MSVKYFFRSQYPLVISLAVSVAASLTAMYYFLHLGVALFVLTAVAAIFSVIKARRKFLNIKKSVSAVNSSLDPNGKDMLDGFPMPVAVCDENGFIVWYNARFAEEVMGKEIIIEDTSVNQFIGGTSFETVKKNVHVNAEYNGKKYTVFQNTVKRHGGELYVLYFNEDTLLKNIQTEYNLAHPSVMLISVDSIEDLYNSFTDSELAEITSGVEKLIEGWFNQYSGFLRRTGSGRFIAVIEERYIRQIIASKFDILEKVRDFSYNDQIVGVTLSIGVGRTGSIEECENDARQAIDMALGRGGDQAALRTDIGYDFFGGVSNGIEKRTKVRTRVVAKAIKELVVGYDSVLIMGHRFSDLDALGAAVGIHKMITHLGVNAKIVMSRKTSLAMPLLHQLEEKGMGGIVIEPQEALEKITGKTLLFVIDTHRPDFVESPELYQKASAVVVIDHHRKTIDHIQNAVIFYHEPHSSSTSEMVTELMQYVSKKPIIGPFEANALLSGIALDTKNFVLRTGVRTFEAAAYLRGRGADTVEVKQLFSNTMETNKQKNEVIANSNTYKTSAISLVEDDSIKDIRIVASQAADEMLYISGVKASYVMFRTENCINISARSMGKMNVQLVMERLGGGGHQTMAAAQLENVDFPEAFEKLKQTIDFFEDDN